MTRVHHLDLGGGIRRTPEFEKKGLATHAVNVGLKCGHDCTYCSTGACVRCYKAFQETGESAYEFGYAIIDPKIHDKVADDARRIRKRGMVQLCTTVDAYDPAAQEHDLGRKCLEEILPHKGWDVRILTKNAAVTADFDLVQKYRVRIRIGLSLTGTKAKQDVIKAIEPNASTISKRMAAMKKAHRMGLRTYGMLCPLLPGISDSYEDILELVGFAKECGAEEVFAEGVNPRGKGLPLTAEALRDHGFDAEAVAVDRIRRKTPDYGACSSPCAGRQRT